MLCNRLSVTASLLLAGCGPTFLGTIDLEVQPEAPGTADEVLVDAIVQQWIDEITVTATQGDQVLTFTGDDLTENPSDGPGATYTVRLSPDDTQKDQVWRFDVLARAGRGELTGTTEVTIANTAPTGTVGLTPDMPTRLDALIATATFDDVDGDDVELTYAWYINGDLTEHTGAELPPMTASRNDQVRVEVIGSDGTDESEPAQAEVTIRNAAPSVQVELSPREPYSDQDLFAIATGEDADGDDLTYEFSWTVNGEALMTTAEELAAHNYGRHDVVGVRVVARDGRTISEPATDEVTVVNQPPGEAVIGMSPSAPTVGANITCAILEPAGDPDGDVVSYDFEWFRNGSEWSGPTLTNVYTDDTIPSSSTVLDDVWSCTVTPTDGVDVGPSSTTEATVVTWSGPRIFTNCGKTGYAGPTQAQCDSSYTDTTLADDTLTVVDGHQAWTVPETGRYRITAYGASGASADGSHDGGKGAKMSGVFDLTGGEVLLITVGQKGVVNGSNGGGGGASWVMDEDDEPLIVAGGGGGTRAVVSQDGCDGRTTQYGGTGSGSGTTWGCGAKTSDLRSGGRVSAGSWGSAGGGFLTAGAADGSWGTIAQAWIDGAEGGSSAANGGFGCGGTGNGSAGGGGGGGYSGGDGGRLAGGGGSFNGGTSQENVAGDNDDHGYVEIDVE